MWMEDIDAFEEAWDELHQPEKEKSPKRGADKTSNGNHKKPVAPEVSKKRKPKQQKKKKPSNESESGEDFEISESEAEVPKPSKKRFVEQQNKEVKGI